VAACAFWWTYFAWVKDALEEGLAAQPPAHVGRFARDVYSFAHFPLIFGVVGFAVAIEESVAHPKDPLDAGGVVALGLGVALILGGAALALVRARERVPIVRWLIIAVALASIPVLGMVPAWVALTLITVLVVGLAVIERPTRLA
jgi:low temperature requirement protein LtrA